MTLTDYTMALSEQHRTMLKASGISPDTAHARGYKTITTKAHLDRLGVAVSGRRVPGLLVPMRRVDGSEWGYQYRPDSPRERAGKSVKYETPTGQRNGIDFPPGVRPLLADLTQTLLITEGTKKADAAVQRGLCCVALPGVWSWKGKPGNDAHEATVAVADWDDVGVKGRGIVLAFDSDVMVKPAVRKALDRLAAFLTARGAAEVRYLVLPDSGDGKTGLDDFLVDHEVTELGQHVHMVMPEPVAEPVSASDGSDGSGRSDGSDRPPIHRGVELSEDVREDGAGLLDEVRAWLARHITVMQDGDLDTLTLWAAHTHASRRLFTTPRLQIDSPVPESGKTTVLEHLERLCFHPVLASSISSPALLARLLEHEPRTLLLDEVDRTLDPKKDGVGELVAILNSGYKVGATRPTLVPVKGGGWEPRELPTFAPVVMAGNQPALPDDTRTRIIRVLLLPDWAGRAEESDWEVKDEQASLLGARLARWSRQADVAHRPEMPPGCTGRFREKWQPLARLAHAAGGRWPGVVTALAEADVDTVRADREAGLAIEKPAVLLLRHLHEVWPIGREFVGTGELVDLLSEQHPEAWGSTDRFPSGLTMQRFGRMLASSYGVRSTTEDTADKNASRGYRRGQFGAAVDAMNRPAVPDVPRGSTVSEVERSDPTVSDGLDPGVSYEPPEPPEASEPPEPAEHPWAASFRAFRDSEQAS